MHNRKHKEIRSLKDLHDQDLCKEGILTTAGGGFAHFSLVPYFYISVQIPPYRTCAAFGILGFAGLWPFFWPGASALWWMFVISLGIGNLTPFVFYFIYRLIRYIAMMACRSTRDTRKKIHFDNCFLCEDEYINEADGTEGTQREMFLHYLEHAGEHAEHSYLLQPICKHGLTFMPAGTAKTLCSRTTNITIKDLMGELIELDPLKTFKEKLKIYAIEKNKGKNPVELIKKLNKENKMGDKNSMNEIKDTIKSRDEDVKSKFSGDASVISGFFELEYNNAIYNKIKKVEYYKSKKWKNMYSVDKGFESSFMGRKDILLMLANVESFLKAHIKITLLSEKPEEGEITIVQNVRDKYILTVSIGKKFLLMFSKSGKKIRTMVNKDFTFKFDIGKTSEENIYNFKLTKGAQYVLCQGQAEKKIGQDRETEKGLVKFIEKLRNDWMSDSRKEAIQKEWKQKLIEPIEKKYFTKCWFAQRCEWKLNKNKSKKPVKKNNVSKIIKFKQLKHVNFNRDKKASEWFKSYSENENAESGIKQLMNEIESDLLLKIWKKIFDKNQTRKKKKTTVEIKALKEKYVIMFQKNFRARQKNKQTQGAWKKSNEHLPRSKSITSINEKNPIFERQNTAPPLSNKIRVRTQPSVNVEQQVEQQEQRQIKQQPKQPRRKWSEEPVEIKVMSPKKIDCEYRDRDQWYRDKLNRLRGNPNTEVSIKISNEEERKKFLNEILDRCRNNLGRSVDEGLPGVSCPKKKWKGETDWEFLSTWKLSKLKKLLTKMKMLERQGCSIRKARGGKELDNIKLRF